jgi:hypothetical protein
MAQVGTLETLCRYPVKSMRGEEEPEGARGVVQHLGPRRL